MRVEYPACSNFKLEQDGYRTISLNLKALYFQFLSGLLLVTFQNWLGHDDHNKQEHALLQTDGDQFWLRLLYRRGAILLYNNLTEFKNGTKFNREIEQEKQNR